MDAEQSFKIIQEQKLEIERLRSEVDRLRAIEIRSEERFMNSFKAHQRIVEFEKKLICAKTEIERLRTALREIAESKAQPGVVFMEQVAVFAIEKARAALAEGKEHDE